MEQFEQSFWARNKKIIIIVAILVILVLWFVRSYNSFITLNESIDGQWAQVENQFQRRFDLIPNLIDTVKGITKQEKDVFSQIANARTQYGSAKSIDEKVKAAGAVESSLSKLLFIAESYPDLKSSQSFQDLAVSLEGTENRLSVERKNYNDLVRSLNIRVKRFPSSIVAGIFSVPERSYFEVADETKINPKVDFTQ